MIAEPSLVVRAGAFYITVVSTLIVWLWRRPQRNILAGTMLGFAWNLPVLLLLNLAAMRWGWWNFDAQGGMFLDIPVDLYLEWAWLWGGLPALAFPNLRLSVLMLLTLSLDVASMPHAAPVMRLGPLWLAGEAIGLAVGLIPGQLLARWTAADRRLYGRAVLQVLLFTGLIGFILPVVAITQSHSSWTSPLDLPTWRLSLFIQILLIPGVIGLTAVQEFVTRGQGTPIPFDPPKRLVTTGIYAYVANPMQLSAVVLLVLAGIMLHNIWVAVAGVMAHIYSAGLAGWDEAEDLRARFGESWIAYRRSVRQWIPRSRPWRPPDQPPALLFVAASCEMCQEVARWFERRGATGLSIIPAETHPSGMLRRITYEPGNGARAAAGIEAIARALEHIHLGWAFVGFAMRLPLVLELVQLFADASGAEPRVIPAARKRSAV